MPPCRTFAMVKPDAVGSMGQVVQAVEAAGFTIRCSPAVHTYGVHLAWALPRC